MKTGPQEEGGRLLRASVLKKRESKLEAKAISQRGEGGYGRKGGGG